MRGLTTARLIIAIVTTALQEVGIYAIWRWLLPEWHIYMSRGALVGVMIVWGLFATWLFIFTTRTLRRQTVVGLPTMVGSRGRAAGRLAPHGMVRIKGELWTASAAEGEVKKGEDVIVVDEDGLKLIVRPTGRRRATR